ncbi:MAG: putative aldouronate transport system permease protein [Clostridiales bacterium]|jgi:putative aldouronate transport system permease protein|nr:putative aldouronate transport system permease protein [Clostridiales bacterium]MDK2902193.1 putative aldouronate transport system permease protein [Clostridiales bacterium]MDK2991797.1 putative aldouronate transport system permease protein [Clostridiales bacterium]
MKTKKMGIQKHYYLMMLPGMLWLLLFSIVPMFGIIMAFQDYNPGQGILHSEWIGLENFRYLFQLDDSKQVIVNTLIISIGKIILNLIVPLIFALLLNEVRSLRYKKFVQTVVFVPHFLSWVIMATIVIGIFGYNGVVNTIAGWFGGQPRLFMADPSIFRELLIGTDVWKEFGYNAVIFLAALTSVNPNLYEAAAIDGANRWQSMWHITLPELTPTIVLLGVLALGNILNAGFDQVYNLYNPLVYSTGDILDTWIYRLGLQNLQFSLATAAGLLKSAVSFILITVSYVLAYKFADYRIF